MSVAERSAGYIIECRSVDHWVMEIVCGSCGSENLTRDPSAQPSASSEIPLLCLDCGWKGSRTPRIVCSRCGSTDVDATPIESSWAYENAEDARENPNAADWGYVDKTVFRCRKCHNQWVTPGEYRPHRSDNDGGRA